MSLHYSKYLDSEIVIEYAKRHGFVVPLNLERFIMDFELHFQISQQLNCIVRGGMCVPFHIGAKRLSVDIDLMTDQTQKDIDQVMDNIGSEFPELIIKQIDPNDPLPVKNLVSYSVEFKSCLGMTTGIKIDFVSDMNLDISKKTSQNIEVFSVPIDHTITILSKGALIGDKISTLALHSIGVPQNTGHVPKQIFDVAGLLNSVDDEIVSDTLNSFDNLTTQKIQNYTSSPIPTTSDILADIDSSLSSLLTMDYTLTSQHNSIYGSFTSTLLGSTTGNYPKLQHVEDILLTKLISKLIPQDPSKYSNQIQVIKNKLNELQRLKQVHNKDAPAERKNLLDSIPTEISLNRKILKYVPLTHVFLAIEHATS